ncbi:MAG: nucleotidyltransferase family protein [Neptuniibacter sp.]
MLYIVVMAAGESKRFGGCKLLAEVDGVTVLQLAITKAEQLVGQKGAIGVITGAWHQQIQNAVQKGTVNEHPLLFNPDWSQGLGNSIAFAVKHIPDEADGLLVMLADQVAVRSEDLGCLARTYKQHDIVCSLYAGKNGAPAIFNRSVFGQLAQLSGDRGAKNMLYNAEFDIKAISIPSAEWDIDSPEELQIFLDKGGSK